MWCAQDIIVPHRILIHEGELAYVHKKGERRRCKLVIMNDIAVVASEGKHNVGTFYLHRHTYSGANGQSEPYDY